MTLCGVYFGVIAVCRAFFTFKSDVVVDIHFFMLGSKDSTFNFSLCKKLLNKELIKEGLISINKYCTSFNPIFDFYYATPIKTAFKSESYTSI